MFYWLRSLFGGRPQGGGVQTPSPSVRLGVGQHVRDEDRALQISAVWACVHLLAETVGVLRPLFQRRMEDVWVEADEGHPLLLLEDDARRRYVVEHVVAHLALHGQTFLRPDRINGRVMGIEVLFPSHVRVVEDDGEVFYDVVRGARVERYVEDEVVHVRRIGDRVIGWSTLEFGSLALGVAAGADRAVSSVYASGGKRSGVLMSDRVLTPQLREQLRQSFQALADGSDGRLLVLEGGMRYEPIAMTPQDIELLAARRYQVAEVCRYFGVPPELVYAETETPAAALREIWRHWVQTTVLSHVQWVETALSLCMAERDRSRWRVRLALQTLLRADDRERMEAWRIAINSGVMTPNEARRREGLPPLPGGDRLMVQGATVPLDERDGG